MADLSMNNLTDGADQRSPDSRIKVDWCQTDIDIIINILAKSVKREDVDVEFRSEKVRVKFLLPTGEKYDRTFLLSKNINRKSCRMTVMPEKVEIKVRKFDCGTVWTALEMGVQPISDSTS